MSTVPASVSRCVKRLGSSLRTARIRRRLSQKDLASLMQVSIGTVQRLEHGDIGVSIGNVAMAFMCLTSLDKLASVLDPTVDEIANAADSLRLPQRVRTKIKKNRVVDQEPLKALSF